jgi:hypothetical protein
VTTQSVNRPDLKRSVPSAVLVTVTRAEQLDDGALCSYQIHHTSGEVRIVFHDKHITAEGRQCLAEMLTEVLGSHYRRVEPLRLVT